MTCRRNLLIVLLCIALPVLLMEPFLRAIDPVGIYSYFADYEALAALSLPAPDGMRFAAGVHRFSMYTATIGKDGLRVVSGNRGGACQIAFVGDSVVFGMGSDVSFVDMLAPEINATVINAGIPGYSAGNVARSIDMIPAEGYVWLIIQNDDDPPARWTRPTGGGMPSATTLYLGYWFPGTYALPERNEPRFIEMAAPVLSRSDVLAFVFDHQALTDVVRREFPQVRVIPHYTGHVSRFDAHPDRRGAQQIADAMREQVAAFVAKRCA